MDCGGGADDGLTPDVPTTEVATTEATTAEVATTEATTAEVATAEATTAEVATTEATTTEATTTEVATTEATTPTGDVKKQSKIDRMHEAIIKAVHDKKIREKLLKQLKQYGEERAVIKYCSYVQDSATAAELASVNLFLAGHKARWKTLVCDVTAAQRNFIHAQTAPGYGTLRSAKHATNIDAFNERWDWLLGLSVERMEHSHAIYQQCRLKLQEEEFNEWRRRRLAIESASNDVCSGDGSSSDLLPSADPAQ